MALSKVQSESINLADDFAFTGTLSASGTVSGFGGGKLLKFASDQGVVTTSTSTIPQDSTTPTSTEGTEVFSLAFTPTAATSTLLIQASFQLAAGDNTKYFIWALFEDSTCIGSWSGPCPYSNNGGMGSFNVPRSASSTSARTYSVRAGLASGTTGTIYIGDVYQNNYGGLNANYMTILEIGA